MACVLNILCVRIQVSVSTYHYFLIQFNSWTHACRVNENSYCAYSKKIGKVILVSDKNNYRPIAIVIALYKIFELCIMRMIEAHLVTSDNQFEFKHEHGTKSRIL